ncbi:unnamed protein product [Cyprideis torosa]|uniref:Uncharacterized protein n=1 Tax=Cyprideis torosa TaxID=163714 RepID=A0A7R8WSQ3_9CRUS|nr:unnamed protein product [Cyprideis torosa]CAG0905043.1 unnamed protein product [Cyprideis torosa]
MQSGLFPPARPGTGTGSCPRRTVTGMHNFTTVLWIFKKRTKVLRTTDPSNNKPQQWSAFMKDDPQRHVYVGHTATVVKRDPQVDGTCPHNWTKKPPDLRNLNAVTSTEQPPTSSSISIFGLHWTPRTKGAGRSISQSPTAELCAALPMAFTVFDGDPVAHASKMESRSFAVEDYESHYQQDAYEPSPTYRYFRPYPASDHTPSRDISPGQHDVATEDGHHVPTSEKDQQLMYNDNEDDDEDSYQDWANDYRITFRRHGNDMDGDTFD